MTEIEDRLRSIQTRLSSAQNSRTRHEVELENATKAREEAKTALKEQFGVVTSEDLTTVRQTLEAEVEAEAAKAEEALSAAGA